MRPWRARLPSLAAKIVVLAAIAAWVLHGLDFPAIGATLRKLPLWVFGAAVLAQIAMQALQARRWKTLMGRDDIPYKDYLGFVSLGYALTLISPSSLLADSANALLLGRRSQAAALSVSAMAAARVLGMIAMLGYFLASMPGHGWVLSLVTWNPRVSALLVIAALAGIIVMVWVAKVFRPPWLEKWRGRIRAAWTQFRFVFSRPSSLFAGLALSFGIQALQFLITWLGFWAMEIPVGIRDVLFFVPLITFITLIPGVGQIGIREGVALFMYTLIPGVSKEQVLASFGYGYALYVLMGLLNLLLATWILRWGKARTAPPA